MATGTSRANISHAKLKTLPIVVPPLEQQMRYGQPVARARDLFSRGKWPLRALHAVELCDGDIVVVGRHHGERR